MLNHRWAGLGSAGIQIALQSWPWPNQVFAISNRRFLFLLALPCLGGGRPRVPSVTSPPLLTESEAPSLPASGRPECPRDGAVWQREAVPWGWGPEQTHENPLNPGQPAAPGEGGPSLVTGAAPLFIPFVPAQSGAEPPLVSIHIAGLTGQREDSGGETGLKLAYFSPPHKGGF